MTELCVLLKPSVIMVSKNLNQTRKMKNSLLILILFLMSVNLSCVQNKDDKPAKATMDTGDVGPASTDSVATAVELFRKTMVDPDQETFDRLISEHLSYGHSTGLIEDKATCIASMVSGKFNFESLDLTDQTIEVVDNTALVRHTFFAHTHDAGKDPTTVKLKVLMVWLKQQGQWKLLARQAVRI